MKRKCPGCGGETVAAEGPAMYFRPTSAFDARDGAGHPLQYAGCLGCGLVSIWINEFDRAPMARRAGKAPKREAASKKP
ncbi:MAG TPA: hypothetical protein VEI02_16325 [Planctomycetota bacterium]|nr:hypothetical protein [Planctomycetota bacterium]